MTPEEYMISIFGENYTEKDKELAATIIRSVPAVFTCLKIQQDQNGNPGFYPVCDSNVVLRFADQIFPIQSEKELIGECEGH